LYNVEVLNQEDPKFVDLVLQGVKNCSFLHFKLKNLAIYVVDVFETFSRQSKARSYDRFSKIKNKIMQFALEVAVLEYSFLNHSQGILGVNPLQDLGLFFKKTFQNCHF
jgi:hypothetical protein